MGRLFDQLQDALAALAAGLLLLTMLAIGADVTLRAAVHISLTFVLEASEHALLAVLFLGMPWLAREGGHIRVELFTDLLSPRAQAALARAVALFVALLLCYLAVWAARLSLADWQRGILTIGIHPIPRFLLPALACGGLALTAAEYLRQAIRGAPRGSSAGSGVA